MAKKTYGTGMRIWTAGGGLRYAGVLALELAVLACVGGCVRQTDTPIIAERTAEETVEAYSGNGDLTDGTAGAEGSHTENFVQEYAKTPSRYEAHITEAGISLSADAPITVPEITGLPHLTVAQLPYEEADRDAMLALLSEELGAVNWLSDDQNQNFYQSQDFWSEDGSYLFSFVSGKTENLKTETETQKTETLKTENGTPIMWLTHQKYSGGSDGTWDPSDLSGCSMTSEERDDRQEELEQKAGTLLEKLDAGVFSLQSVQWRRIGENGKPTDRCGLQLTYVRELEGIPVLLHSRGWAARTLPTSQYVTLLYLEDGTLLELKHIGREQVVSEDGYADALLSFDAVAQIFEQYMRYYQTVFQPENYVIWMAEGSSQESGMPAAGLEGELKPRLYIHVTGVSFGYQLESGSDPSSSSRRSDPARLVPIWAFYGTPLLGYDYTGGSGSGYTIPGPYRLGYDGELLVTINAEDGTVYGKVYTEAAP